METLGTGKGGTQFKVKEMRNSKAVSRAPLNCLGKEVGKAQRTC